MNPDEWIDHLWWDTLSRWDTISQNEISYNSDMVDMLKTMFDTNMSAPTVGLNREQSVGRGFRPLPAVPPNITHHTTFDSFPANNDYFVYHSKKRPGHESYFKTWPYKKHFDDYDSAYEFQELMIKGGRWATISLLLSPYEEEIGWFPSIESLLIPEI